MTSLLSNLFSWGYRRASSPLAPERFVRSAKGFGFGVPWPWEEVPFEKLQGVDEAPDLAVGAPRADGRAPLFILTERAPWNGLEATDTKAMLHAFASKHAAQPMGIRKVALAGAPAQVLGVRTPQYELHLLLTSLGPNQLEGFLRIPSAAYLHHFEVFLATWSWTG